MLFNTTNTNTNTTVKVAKETALNQLTWLVTKTLAIMGSVMTWCISMATIVTSWFKTQTGLTVVATALIVFLLWVLFTQVGRLLAIIVGICVATALVLYLIGKNTANSIK